MNERRRLRLIDESVRRRAIEAVRTAPVGFEVVIGPPRRSNDQNAIFHAICSDIARSGLTWAGKARDAAAWKVLLVSGHAAATKEGAEMVLGIENEFVNLREATSRMSRARASSLIEYAIAFAAEHGVRIHDYEQEVAE